MLVAGSGGFDVVVLEPRPGLSPVAPGTVGAVPDERDADLASTDFLAQLFDAHYRSLCRLAYVFLADSGHVEDVVQEAFLRTFTGVGRLRDKSRADAYLRRSVVNLCRSRLRRRSVQGRDRGYHCGEDLVEGPAPRDPDVLAAVRALPLRQRAAVVLFYYADLPEAEVAATLGCSVGTVKSQLAKARATLARRLGGQPEEGQ
jgi:RNA polymerase sigma-70 factor (sigma-E family)